MTKIEIELSEATAKAAREAGLLSPRELSRFVAAAIKRRQATTSLRAVSDHVAQAGIPPMPMSEINAEVKAVRAQGKRRARRR